MEVTQNLFHTNDRRSRGEFGIGLEALYVGVMSAGVRRPCSGLWSRRRCTSNPRNSRDYRTGLVHNFMKRVGQSSILMLLIRH